ncbi:histidine phosphatase family protein [Lacimicrobium alkaliphilum]|uniref:Histidine phosphatase family protein n=1 Tax=Lacimicrobium alkaliphilum TaxID=1526571 RepID=A0ABQ1R6L5_9ALTE|nr:histidine phosphatase family protein [Lacimicrobium alkaliphilum]GGD60114.1 histidine phosphatase family protein [Lacimicrobium alkaliphilum]
MQKIYLLRHGQAGFDQADYDALSPTGRQQAWRLGRFFADNGISFTAQQIISGSMLRHRQTLQALWQGLNQQPVDLADPIDDRIEQNADWNEYDHHNVLAALNPEFANPQGLKAYLLQQADPSAAFAQTFSQAISKWTNSEPGNEYIESWEDFCARVKRGISAATEKPHNKLLVITSGGPISVLAQQLLGVPEKHFLNINWVLANCGVSRLLNGRNGLRLSSLNDYTAFDGTPELITYK